MAGSNGKKSARSPNGKNGRNSDGTFAKGNPGGPGNPQGKKLAQLRAKMTEVVTPEDMVEVWKSLLKAALKGEPWAVREILNRVHGKAPETVKLDASVYVEKAGLDLLQDREVAHALDRAFARRAEGGSVAASSSSRN